MPMTRAQVLARARSWLTPPVPYSQTSFHTNEFGCYRTDCSGFVSMAWALPGRPPSRHGGLDTAGLAAVSHPIAKDDLAAGDVLLLADGTPLTRHVAIFESWTDGRRTAYWALEQLGGTGTTHRVIGYPYDPPPASGHYRPHRNPRLG
jgi:hypothetical protein